MNKRLQKLRRRFAENEIDAVFITQSENRRYLSGFNGTAGILLITEKKAVLATDFRYTEQAAGEATDFEILHIAGNLADWFPGQVRDAGIKKLGFEAGDVTFNFHRQLNDVLKKKKVAARLVPVNGLVESLRAVKEPGEIELIRKAAAVTDAAYERVEGIIKAGMTEKQVAWELEKSLRENGSQALPFEIIVASGAHASLPHARPSERVINEGEPVLIDMGAKYEGYAGDLSRTICVGAPDDTFKRVYKAVLDAQTAAMSIINAGMTGHQADSAARDVIQKAGYGEAFGHSLGHGVGLAAHELPRLGPGSEELLTEGMIFTVEPGIYLSGWGGVRIEDTVVMENGRAVALSRARKARYD
ncbi:MAG TPA: aminopeptidase P family protein [Dehalococcoidales bacterium]|nr:aminopeptidase P family protein [Dehalococcoidales bacterium]